MTFGEVFLFEGLLDDSLESDVSECRDWSVHLL